MLVRCQQRQRALRVRDEQLQCPTCTWAAAQQALQQQQQQEEEEEEEEVTAGGHPLLRLQHYQTPPTRRPHGWMGPGCHHSRQQQQ
jgi:hypothetical protein